MGGASVRDRNDGDHPAVAEPAPGRNGPGYVASARNGEPPLEWNEIMSEHDELLRAQLLERIDRLERELERHRELAQQTSRLFLFATNYADSIRERARRDAEVALRKARERATKIVGDAESDRRHAENELLRLQALTDETRKRLSAFTTAALQVLNAEVETGRDNVSERTLGDLQDALQSQLSPASGSAPRAFPSAGSPER